MPSPPQLCTLKNYNTSITSELQNIFSEFKLIVNFWGFVPTILRIGSYRFYFYSHEPNEPPHIHVDKDNLSAKFWLEEISLAKNLGFSQKEINTLQKLAMKHQKHFLDKWHEYFNS